MASGGGVLSWSVLSVVLAGLAFSLFVVQPANIRGSLRTLEGVNALTASSVARIGLARSRLPTVGDELWSGAAAPWIPGCIDVWPTPK